MDTAALTRLWNLTQQHPGTSGARGGMNAWTASPAALGARSICLPRDGGVLNPATRGRYLRQPTDLRATFAAERARLAAAALPPAELDLTRAAAVVRELALDDPVRGWFRVASLAGHRLLQQQRQCGALDADWAVALACAAIGVATWLAGGFA